MGTSGDGGKARGPAVFELGEAALVERIRDLLSRLAPADSGRVPVNIGDDAAVLASPGAGAHLIATCDMLVEGIHFLRDAVDPKDLGHKALAVNLSDVAAMGGAAGYALVSLALPPDLPVAFVDGLYEGLARLAAGWGVGVVGGDTVGSPGPVVIDVAVLGQVLPGGPFRAAAAQPGDLLCVTGHLGASAAGLALILRERDRSTGPGVSARPGTAPIPPVVADALRRAHLRPEPRLAEAAVLAALAAEAGGRRAARDLSDGLAAGAWLLAEASGCAVELWAGRIPVAPAARQAAAVLGLDPLDLALFGGEDYELFFTTTEAELPGVEREVPERTGTPVTAVGRVVAGSGVRLVDPSGRVRDLPRQGFDHFARARGGGWPVHRGNQWSG